MPCVGQKALERWYGGPGGGLRQADGVVAERLSGDLYLIEFTEGKSNKGRFTFMNASLLTVMESKHEWQAWNI